MRRQNCRSYHFELMMLNLMVVEEGRKSERMIDRGGRREMG